MLFKSGLKPAAAWLMCDWMVGCFIHLLLQRSENPAVREEGLGCVVFCVECFCDDDVGCLVV
jgi:hypothetical protein